MIVKLNKKMKSIQNPRYLLFYDYSTLVENLDAQFIIHYKYLFNIATITIRNSIAITYTVILYNHHYLSIKDNYCAYSNMSSCSVCFCEKHPIKFYLFIGC